MAIKLKINEFKKCQQQKGLTDTELVKLMGVNRSQIWQVERGENSPEEIFIY